MKEYGVLFDYNGVIVDDEHIHEKAMRHVMAQYNLDLTHVLYIEYCLGRTDKAAFESLITLLSGRTGSVQALELVRQKAAEYKKLIKAESIVHPAISTVLRELNEEYLLGVVTASLREEVIPVLRENNILDFFKTIVTAGDVMRGKPDPEGYTKGMSELGLTKDQTLVIEDTPTGVAAAKASGAKCVAVLHTVAQDQLSEADRIAESVREVTPELVEGIVGGG